MNINNGMRLEDSGNYLVSQNTSNTNSNITYKQLQKITNIVTINTSVIVDIGENKELRSEDSWEVLLTLKK